MTKTLTKGQTYDLATLRFVGWTAEGDGSETDGYNWMDYFDADGRYYGPDIYGIEPLFAEADAESRLAAIVDADAESAQ